MRYTFLGSVQTRADLVGLQCDPVKDSDGKCIISQQMATALVIDADGKRHVVPRRRLRLNSTYAPGDKVLLKKRGRVGTVQYVEIGTRQGKPCELLHVQDGDYVVVCSPKDLDDAPVQMELWS